MVWLFMHAYSVFGPVGGKGLPIKATVPKCVPWVWATTQSGEEYGAGIFAHFTSLSASYRGQQHGSKSSLDI